MPLKSACDLRTEVCDCFYLPLCWWFAVFSTLYPHPGKVEFEFQSPHAEGFSYQTSSSQHSTRIFRAPRIHRAYPTASSRGAGQISGTPEAKRNVSQSAFKPTRPLTNPFSLVAATNEFGRFVLSHPVTAYRASGCLLNQGI